MYSLHNIFAKLLIFFHCNIENAQNLTSDLKAKALTVKDS
ncbi:hypothetical protein HMPREF9444_01806 [Succinatimonas hippei YIT 12066]|uniref:Uncharacterized protein n=1 Tax=Succinatimonas hippei (strain DSM 22608 / JCM 16073 / KCTC 15190 / YIT 12066) TaxID=762983 RepID=E8LM32_SUCHY|nr:hypothetical protein HMPREF9444_01806 [Succinatimonas hippei YIT 12066]